MDDYPSEKLPKVAPAKRKRSPCAKWLIGTTLTVALLGVVGIGALLLFILVGARAPHSTMYVEKPLEEIEDRSTVVRPLVDEQQKFDIVATVWARRPGGSRNFVRVAALYKDDDALFHGVVFEGVTMLDKHVHGQVQLSIPMDVL